MWDETRLQSHIDNFVEESLTLDYKAADALALADGKKREISKDVSAMANSAGGLIIYGLREFKDPSRVDKICIAVSLLKARFGHELTGIPRSLLRFIAETKFRYGVRSIAHLIDLISTDAFRNGGLKQTSLGLPFANEAALQQSSLKLHLLDKDQGFGIVNRWTEVSKDKLIVKLRAKHLRYWYIDDVTVRSHL